MQRQNFTQPHTALMAAIHSRCTLLLNRWYGRTGGPTDQKDFTMALFSRTFVATAVLAALSLPALAQSTATNEAASAPTQTQTQTQVQTQPATAGVQTMRRAPNRAKMQERMAQRQAALKHSLELSPAQEPAWNTFITSMQPGERPARLGQLNRDEMQKLTTPERIERMRAQRAQRHAQADRRADAALAFYAELNPAQQKTFDAHTARHQHMGYGDNLRGNSGRGMGKKDGSGRWQQRQNEARRDI